MKKDRVYSPVKVIEEWRKLEVPSFRFFNRAVWAVIGFTILFAGYFALCELGSVNLVQYIYSL